MVALEEGLLRQEYDHKDLRFSSTKTIYTSRIVDIVPAPKIENKYPMLDFPSTVYPRLNYRILESEPKDILFTLVHKLVFTKERMFLQNRLQDPFCPLQECQGRVQDQEHLFTSCVLVVEAWLWLLTRLLRLLPTTVGAQAITSEDFLLLHFPKDIMDKECVWLLGNYCDLVSKEVIAKKKKLGADQLAGRLRTRIQDLKSRAVVQPNLYNI